LASVAAGDDDGGGGGGAHVKISMDLSRGHWHARAHVFHGGDLRVGSEGKGRLMEEGEGGGEGDIRRRRGGEGTHSLLERLNNHV